MAKLRIGINGFGRIGSLVLRGGIEHPELEFVAVNDLAPAESLAYLLKYDSTHGRFPGTVEVSGEDLVVNGMVVKCLSERDPAALPWGKLGVDYVVESTGLFTKYDGAINHIHAGAKRVVISAPTKDPDKVSTFVMGVNHESFDPAKDNVVSNASCTTNGLAPIAMVLNQHFGLAEGLMTTIHAATGTQHTIDAIGKKDLRAGRAASQNLIPSSTGAAKAVALVLPALKGKLTGMAVRVPTTDVSVVDLTFKTEKSTSYAEICDAMKTAAAGPLNGILGYTEEGVVSSDFITDSRSTIFDAGAGLELNSNFFKVLSWYDNEWGYSMRVIDLMIAMGKKEGVLS
ncbi:MAG: type I glyceraldehyde-3-phosphate dehydrogenase [Cyanobacteria bacterium P01_H01_bin.21]